MIVKFGLILLMLVPPDYCSVVMLEEYNFESENVHWSRAKPTFEPKAGEIIRQVTNNVSLISSKHNQMLWEAADKRSLDLKITQLIQKNPKRVTKSIINTVIEAFRVYSVALQLKRQKTDDCGINAINGTLEFVNCPGKMTVFSLNKIETISCAKIGVNKYYGPVLIFGKSCLQILNSDFKCPAGTTMDPRSNLCVHNSGGEGGIWLTTSLSIALCLCLLMLTSVVVFIIRMGKISKSHTVSFQSGDLNVRTYSHYTRDGENVNLNVNLADRPNITEKKIRVPWYQLVASLLCFVPLKVEGYELLQSQIMGTHHMKYSILMDQNEVIPVGVSNIKFDNVDDEVPLIYLFDTMNWDIDYKSEYRCFQSGCNDLTTCREDLLPFSKSNGKINDFLGFQPQDYTYSTCRNMRQYCQIGNGCIIIGFRLVDHDRNSAKVYRVGKVKGGIGNLNLPYGCFLDSIHVADPLSLSELYYVEKTTGESWLCHSSVYSYHSLPNTLGDLKIIGNETVGFIIEQVRCAADTWRDVYCKAPTSFMENIDKHCLRASKDNLGYELIRTTNGIRWGKSEEYTVKISCDRDLKLKGSDKTCLDVQLDVWDLGTLDGEILLTVKTSYKALKPYFKIPLSVHVETHLFPCDGKTYSTLLLDVLSLNSSGLQYTYHGHDSSFVPEDDHGEDVPTGGQSPNLEDIWDNIKNYIHGALGLSSMVVVIVILVILFVLCKK